MPNRYHSPFKSLKISATGARPSASKGSTPSITVKPAMPSLKLPGKAQPRDRSMGTPKVKTHAQHIGL